MADVASTSFSDEECLRPASNAPKRPRSRALFEDVTNKEDSFDSFDSFDSPQKKQAPKKRSPALITSNLGDATSKDSFDSFDSFDSPPTKKSRISPKKRSPARFFPLESGVPGFPALYDLDGVTLSVQTATVTGGQAILDCIDLKTHQQSFAYLQDQWAELGIVAGDTIRIFDAQRWKQNDWIVDAEHGVIITQPDTLVSATSVSQALFCQRKAVLGDRFRGGNSTNKAMFMGSIIHDLFQTAIQQPPGTVTGEWLLKRWRTSIDEDPSALVALVALNFSPSTFEAELDPYVNIICQWVRDKMAQRRPLPSGATVSQVADIEENIWLPKLGIKGKIDATLRVQKNGTSYLEPLELKTGRSGASHEHSLQVLLYSLMLSITEASPIRPASLLYLKDGVARNIEPKAIDLKGILSVRNRIAGQLGDIARELPEPLTETRPCGRCEHAMACSLYGDYGGTQKVSAQFSAFAEASAAYLKPAHAAYFKKWMHMLTLELKTAQSKSATPSLIWTMAPEAREMRGTCVGDLRLGRVEKAAAGGRSLLVFER
ncbi:unnamed protein product, partial [Mesorhabditis spiculigera]